MLEVRTFRGVAGAVQVSALVDYGDGASWVAFHGSRYGGGVVMVTDSGIQVWVHRDVLERCGSTLDAGWVRRFFAPVEGGAL